MRFLLGFSKRKSLDVTMILTDTAWYSIREKLLQSEVPYCTNNQRRIRSRHLENFYPSSYLRRRNKQSNVAHPRGYTLFADIFSGKQGFLLPQARIALFSRCGKVLSYMAIVNAEVTKKPNENSQSLIRRFTRRVQGTGLVRRVRSNRYADRNKSAYVVKKKKLQRIGKYEKVQELIKLGKIKPRTRHSR